ncbi:uncharacterized protein EI90DRAFT_2852726, partial [Cantharellus anzutake]|uniref:uncharacterized protein n=1 Tax=Cantharellus anzutake TaxID=1750568 RepID=UPI001904E452
KYVVLVHGDLGSLEKIDTILRSRRIEESVGERMHYLLPLPGLFHVKMACVDAINRVHSSSPDMRQNPYGLYKQLVLLFPNDIAKLNKKVPPFRMMNDGISYVLQTAILDAWSESVGDLDKYKESGPTWDEIESQAALVQSSCFETKGIHTFQQEKDQQRENQVLFNRDAMYYQILAHAINHGMMDIILDVLSCWVPIFFACGKHKYASYISEFTFRLKQYPRPLRTAILKCWLCNPMGTRDGFRPVDWLVELMNLYTKVVYSGSGSGRTIRYIISQSSIIKAYRACLEETENDYRIPDKTLRHAHPDIQSRLNTIRKRLREFRPHQYKKGRKAACLVTDHYQKGL